MLMFKLQKLEKDTNSYQHFNVVEMSKYRGLNFTKKMFRYCAEESAFLKKMQILCR